MGKEPKISPGGSKIGAKLPPRCLPGRPWEPLGPLRAPWLGAPNYFDPPGRGSRDPRGRPWGALGAKMDAKRRPRGSSEPVGLRGGVRELCFSV